MKTKLEILEEKFNKNFPRSIKAINDGLQFAVDNNTSWAKGCVFIKELSTYWQEQQSEVAQMVDLLVSKGYYAVESRSHDHWPTTQGNAYEQCYGLYIFFDRISYEIFKKVDWTDIKQYEKYKFANMVPTEHVSTKIKK